VCRMFLSFWNLHNTSLFFILYVRIYIFNP
jgi:hypothetical protein